MERGSSRQARVEGTMNDQARTRLLILTLTVFGTSGCDEHFFLTPAPDTTNTDSDATLRLADAGPDSATSDFTGGGYRADETMEPRSERATGDDGEPDDIDDIADFDDIPDAGIKALPARRPDGPCVVGAQCEATFCRYVGRAEIDGVAPTPAEFADGEPLSAGCYRLSYVEGTYVTGGRGTMSRPYRYAVGTLLYSDGEQVGDRIASGAYPSADEAEASGEDARLVFQHCGGTIAVGNGDLPPGSADNDQGDPNPIWRLETCESFE